MNHHLNIPSITNTKKSFSLLICFLLSLVACTTKQEKTTPPISEAFVAERTAFFNSFQNTAEVSDTLLPGLSGFEERLLHNPSTFHRYASNDVKAAANLGVYLADLNYCILYKESALGKTYLEAAIELSKIILLEKKTLEFLMQRYENNLAQNDSVKAVMQQLFSHTTVGLQGTIRERLAGIAMAAYQIENLHLALATLETFPPRLNEEQQKSKDLLVQFVSDQQAKMEVVYNFIKTHSDPLDPESNPNYPFYDNALREILYVYQQSANGELKTKELQAAIDVLRSKIISIE